MISERAKLVSWAYLVTDLAATTAAFVGAHAIRSWSLAHWVGPVYPLSDYAPLLTAFVLPVWALTFYVNGLYGRRAARTLHTEMSRLFRALVMCALVVLLRQARAADQLRVASIAAVMAGAMGNLFDRLRWERGVVDFIGPFNLGFAHFPIFNVADMAITVGAAALAISLWLEERNVEPAQAEAAEPTTDLV